MDEQDYLREIDINVAMSKQIKWDRIGESIEDLATATKVDLASYIATEIGNFRAHGLYCEDLLWEYQSSFGEWEASHFTLLSNTYSLQQLPIHHCTNQVI